MTTQLRLFTERGEATAYLALALRRQTDHCIPWPFATNGGGYPVIGSTANRTRSYVHRLACAHRNGPPPPGLTASHLCGNSLCINPRHLVWETIAANVRRKVEHGTHQRGEHHGQHKLTTADVLAIRERYANGERQRALAAEYGICQQTVSNIVQGDSWAWLT